MHSALLVSLSFYALLVLVGGTIGYLKAKSRASLISGILFGILLAVAAGLVATGSPRAGAGLGILLALALLGRFLPAFIKTKKVMPAGLVVIGGVVVTLLGVLTLITGQ